MAVHACLHHRFATSGKLERWPLRGPAVDRPVTAVPNTIEPLITMAEQDLGIACLPGFAVRRQLAEDSLVAILDSHTEHSGTFRLLWPSSRHLSPKLRVSVDFMAGNLFSQ